MDIKTFNRYKTNKNKRIKLIQSIFLSVLTMSGMLMISRKATIVCAEDLISIQHFATRKQLQSSFGLGEGDKIGRVRFGTRPTEVQYHMVKATDYSDYSNHSSVKAGPIVWLVAGSDTENTITLYSQEPVLGSTDLTENFSGLFQLNSSVIEKSSDVDYEYLDNNVVIEKVYSNHWGESNLRKQLKAFKENINYFTKAEQKLMNLTTIVSIDPYNYNSDTDDMCKYRTKDVFYVPTIGEYEPYYNNELQNVYVGQDDTLPIHNSNWKGMTWSRSPDLAKVSTSLLVPTQNGNLATIGANSSRVAISPAFSLDITDVDFLSSVPEEGSGFLDISIDMPVLTMRMNEKVASAIGVNIGELSISGNVAKMKNAAGSRLVIQSVMNGKNWSYTQDIESNDSVQVNVRDIVNAKGKAEGITNAMDTFNSDTSHIWLEKANDGVLYASQAKKNMSISLNKDAMTLQVGDSELLTATVQLIDDVSDDSVVWFSDNDAVATVDVNGLVTAHSLGSTTITASLKSNPMLIATCKVTVVDPLQSAYIKTGDSSQCVYAILAIACVFTGMLMLNRFRKKAWRDGSSE